MKLFLFSFANLIWLNYFTGCIDIATLSPQDLKEAWLNGTFRYNASVNSSQLKVSEDPNDIRFFLFRNPADEDDRTEIPLHDVGALFNSGYKFSKPLIILLHGVLSDSLTIHDVQILKNEYLRLGTEANIIMVDYGPLTVSPIPFVFSTLSFVTILSNKDITNIVGGRVTDYLLYLLSITALRSLEDVHMIGFSVGAHMAGAVGRDIYARTGNKIRRITGLDPSPQFPKRPKLEPSDAEFVDVTLTSLGKLATFKTEGHAMFFINGGGPHQQHCPNFLPFTETYCSHTTSIYYFAKSMRKRSILGCLCRMPCLEPPDVCRLPVVYGQHVPLTARGNYYVDI